MKYSNIIPILDSLIQMFSNNNPTWNLSIFSCEQTWFKIYYNDHRIPDDYFKQQLWVWRATFNELLNMVNLHVADKIHICKR